MTNALHTQRVSPWRIEVPRGQGGTGAPRPSVIASGSTGEPAGGPGDVRPNGHISQPRPLKVPTGPGMPRAGAK